MILYYALGSGLGPLTRAVRIANLLTHQSLDVRIIASSIFVNLARASSRVPIDQVNSEVLKDRKIFLTYMKDYLEKEKPKLIIVDSLPYGMVGELSKYVLEVPRILVARNIIIDEYLSFIDFSQEPHWQGMFHVDEISPSYKKYMDEHFEESYAFSGLLYSPQHWQGEKKDAALIVHNGPFHEINQLHEFTENIIATHNFQVRTVSVLTPGDGIFPVEEFLDSFVLVTSGAGYFMATHAAFADNHFLHPFKRKFDDQYFRSKSLEMQSGVYKKPYSCLGDIQETISHVIKRLVS